MEEYTDGLFEQNGSIMEYCYKNGIITNDENIYGYGVYNHYAVDKLEKISINQIKIYIENTYMNENKLLYLDIAITLSTFANYLLRMNNNVQFFAYVYEIIIEDDMCGIEFAKELLLHSINIKTLRAEHPEYPYLRLTDIPKDVVKVYIPFSDMTEYFQKSEYPHLNIGNEKIQAHLVYWSIHRIEEYCIKYPQFANYIEYIDDRKIC